MPAVEARFDLRLEAIFCTVPLKSRFGRIPRRFKLQRATLAKTGVSLSRAMRTTTSATTGVCVASVAVMVTSEATQSLPQSLLGKNTRDFRCCRGTRLVEDLECSGFEF